MEAIIENARSLFPNDLFDELLSKVTEKQLLETLVYEITLGVTNDNYKKSIEIIDDILSIDSNLINIIYDISNNYMKYITKGSFEFFNHYDSNNEYTKDMYEYMLMYIIDDIDAYNDFCVSRQYCDINEIKNDLYNETCRAIRCEAVKIFKKIILENDINEIKDRFKDLGLFESAVMSCGNFEILHILEQNGFEFSKINSYDIYTSHLYDVIDWIRIHFSVEDIKSLHNTSSLIYHHVYNIPIPKFMYKKLHFLNEHDNH